MLEADGHQAEGADGGVEGLAVLAAQKEDSEPFDVVITDLGMPHMDGREVARRVKLAFPRMPVIMLSGWGSQMRINGELPDHVDCVLGKPPTSDGLRRALGTVLRRQI